MDPGSPGLTRIVTILGVGRPDLPHRYEEGHYAFGSIRTKSPVHLPLILHLQEALDRGARLSLVAIVTAEADEVWLPGRDGELRRELAASGFGALTVVRCVVDPTHTTKLVQDVYEALIAIDPNTGLEPDRIVVDITHGFRSLGVLTTAAVEAFVDRALRDNRPPAIEIRYGAFEARSIDNSPWVAPIWDLTPLVLQHQWTAAIHALRRYARADAFASLCRTLSGQLHHRSDHVGRVTVQKLGQAAKTFADGLATCRLPDILTRTAADFMRCIDAATPTLVHYASAMESPLRELRGLSEKLCAETAISPQGVAAGLELAKVAYSTDRFAECAAILREVVVTAFSVIRLNPADLVQPNQRQKGGFKDWRHGQERELNALLQMVANGTAPTGTNPQLVSLAKFFQGLTGTRNDIEHAGMSAEDVNAASLRRTLERHLEAAESLLRIPAP
jgi:CRISPR-associated DxTHG motif protein